MMTPQIKDLYYLNLNQTADAIGVCSHIINETMQINPSYFEQEVHYMFMDEKLYFSRMGIIRLALLVQTDEGLKFATIMEKELLAFESFYLGLSRFKGKE